MQSREKRTASVILAIIMVAGGLTLAFPSIPLDVEAQTPTATLSFSTPDSEWHSGERGTISVTSSSFNTNSSAKDTITIHDGAIPTVVRGTPFTLGQVPDSGDKIRYAVDASGSDSNMVSALDILDGKFNNAQISLDSSNPSINLVPTDLLAFIDGTFNLNHSTGNSGGGVAPTNLTADPIHHTVTLPHLDNYTQSRIHIVDNGRTLGDLRDFLMEDEESFQGTRFLQYDITALANNPHVTTPSTGDPDRIYIGLAVGIKDGDFYKLLVNPGGSDFIVNSSGVMSGYTRYIHLATIEQSVESAYKGIINLDDPHNRHILKHIYSDGMTRNSTINADKGTFTNESHLALVYMTSQPRVSTPGQSDTIYTDFIKFGFTNDLDELDDRLADNIARIELEETGNNTGIFEGNLTHNMMNQFTILDEDYYESLDFTGQDARLVTRHSESLAIKFQEQTSSQTTALVSDPISFDTSGTPTYVVGEGARVIINDPDLNVDLDVQDVYTPISDIGSETESATSESVYASIGKAELPKFAQMENDADNKVPDTTDPLPFNLGSLVSIYFDDTDIPNSLWTPPEYDTGNGNTCSPSDWGQSPQSLLDAGLDGMAATLIEDMENPGTFILEFEIPTHWCDKSGTQGTVRQVDQGETDGGKFFVSYRDFTNGRANQNTPVIINLRAETRSSAMETTLSGTDWKLGQSLDVSYSNVSLNRDPSVIDTLGLENAPVLVSGNPFTLGTTKSGLVLYAVNPDGDSDPSTNTFDKITTLETLDAQTTPTVDIPINRFNDKTTFFVNEDGDSLGKSYEPDTVRHQMELVPLEEQVSIRILDAGMTLGDLRDYLLEDSTSARLFNYDVRDIAQNAHVQTPPANSTDRIYIGLAIKPHLYDTQSQPPTTRLVWEKADGVLEDIVYALDVGNPEKHSLGSDTRYIHLVSLEQDEPETHIGSINLNAQENARILTNIFSDTDNIDDALANNPLDTDNIALVIMTSHPRVDDNTSDVIYADFARFGYTSDGNTSSDRFADHVVRLELEETGIDTKTFSGSLTPRTIHPFAIGDPTYYPSLTFTGKDADFVSVIHQTAGPAPKQEIEFFLFSDGSRVRWDFDSRAVTVPDHANQTHSIPSVVPDGSLSQIALTSVGGTVDVSITDLELNLDPNLVEIFTVVSIAGDPAIGTVGRTGYESAPENMDRKFDYNFGTIFAVFFYNEIWLDPEINTSTDGDNSCSYTDEFDNTPKGLGDAGSGGAPFTLVETGPDTGIFEGTFTVPSKYCDRSGTSSEIKTTVRTDIYIRYFDFTSPDVLQTNTSIKRVTVGPISIAPNPVSIVVDGDNPYYLKINGSFNDPGVTATDERGEELSVNIDLTPLKRDIRGIYTIPYTVSHPDNPDTINTATRTVIVYDDADLVNFVFEDGNTSENIDRRDEYMPSSVVYRDSVNNKDYRVSDSLIMRTPDTIDTIPHGTHPVQYAISDSNGQLITTLTRTTIVGTGEMSPIPDLEFTTPDSDWNSGERGTVTVTNHALNLDYSAKDTITIHNGAIPTVTHGTPFTLGQTSSSSDKIRYAVDASGSDVGVGVSALDILDGRFSNSQISRDPDVPTRNLVPADLLAFIDGTFSLNHSTGESSGGVAPTNLTPDPIHHTITLPHLDNYTQSRIHIVDNGRTLGDLRDFLMEEEASFQGTRFLQYDITALANNAHVTTPSSGENDRIYIGLAVGPKNDDFYKITHPSGSDFIVSSSGAMSGYTRYIHLATIEQSVESAYKGIINLDDPHNRNILEHIYSDGTTRNSTINSSGGTFGNDSHIALVYMTSQPRVSTPGQSDTIYTDFIKFGFKNNLDEFGDRIADNIARIELEETENDTGIFEGKLTHNIMNQHTILDADYYESLDFTSQDARLVTSFSGTVDIKFLDHMVSQNTASFSTTLSFDKSRYALGDTVKFTIIDPDLNVDIDGMDVYTTVNDIGSETESREFRSVYANIGKAELPKFAQIEQNGNKVPDTTNRLPFHLGSIVAVFFDMQSELTTLWAPPDYDINGDGNLCASDRWGDTPQSLLDAGPNGDPAILAEDANNPGTFILEFELPVFWCDRTSSPAEVRLVDDNEDIIGVDGGKIFVSYRNFLQGGSPIPITHINSADTIGSGTLEVEGPTTLYVKRSDTASYTHPTFSAIHVSGEDVSQEVSISSVPPIDLSTIGTYSITYEIDQSHFLADPIQHTVHVWDFELEDPPGENWKHGQSLDVTYSNPGLDLDSSVIETLGLEDAPVIVYGDPFTLATTQDGLVLYAANPNGDSDPSTATFDKITTLETLDAQTTPTVDIPINRFNDKATFFVNDDGDSIGKSYQPDTLRHQMKLVSLGEQVSIRIIDTGMTLGDLRDYLLDDFTGTRLFNYDVRSIAQNAHVETPPANSTDRIHMGLAIKPYLSVTQSQPPDTRTAWPKADGVVDTALYALDVGNPEKHSLGSDTRYIHLVSLEQDEPETHKGSINLDSTENAKILENIFSDTDNIDDTLANNPLDADSIALVIMTSHPRTDDGNSDIVYADFARFGYQTDVYASPRFADSVLRLNLEETGADTAVFTGSITRHALSQFLLNDSTHYENLDYTGKDVDLVNAGHRTSSTVIQPPDIEFFPPAKEFRAMPVSDSRGVLVPDEGSINIAIPDLVSAGSISQVSESNVGGTIDVTITDSDLNLDSDTAETLTLVTTADDPAIGTIGRAGYESAPESASSSSEYNFGSIFAVFFDGEIWLDPETDTSPDGDNSCSFTDEFDNTPRGLGDAGSNGTAFTLTETGTDTGVFEGTFTIPSKYCDRSGVYSTIKNTKDADMVMTYFDFNGLADMHIVNSNSSVVIDSRVPQIMIDSDFNAIVGMPLDLMTGVTGVDIDGLDITSQITSSIAPITDLVYFPGGTGTIIFEPDAVGTEYTITYNLTSGTSMASPATRTFTVLDVPAPPVISGADDLDVQPNSSTNMSSGVTAQDSNNQDISSDITYTVEPTHNFDGESLFTRTGDSFVFNSSAINIDIIFTYRVEDSLGTVGEATRVVRVLGPANISIPAGPSVIDLDGTFNAINDLTVSSSSGSSLDKQNITSTINPFNSTVQKSTSNAHEFIFDTSEGAKYFITYADQSNSTTKIRPLIASAPPTLTLDDDSVNITPYLYDATDGVTFTGYTDGDILPILTSSISPNNDTVTQNGNLYTFTAGAVGNDYTITYTLTDLFGRTASDTRTVSVLAIPTPTLNIPTNIPSSVAVGDFIDLLDGFTGTDADGTDISSRITVSISPETGYHFSPDSPYTIFFESSAAGTNYTITYNLVNEDGFSAPDVSLTIFVGNKAAPPTFEGISDIVHVEPDMAYDPLSGVTAKGYDNENLTSSIEWTITPVSGNFVKSNDNVTFNANARGEQFFITYTVQDSDNRETIQENIVLVPDPVNIIVPRSIFSAGISVVPTKGTFDAAEGVSVQTNDGQTLRISNLTSSISPTSKVTKNGNLYTFNTDLDSDYTITYSYTHEENTATKTRSVLAWNFPTITLDTSSVNIAPAKTYSSNTGVTATDGNSVNILSNLTSSIEPNDGMVFKNGNNYLFTSDAVGNSYIITYGVMDSANVPAVPVTRTVNIVQPTIELAPDAPSVATAGSYFDLLENVAGTSVEGTDVSSSIRASISPNTGYTLHPDDSNQLLFEEDVIGDKYTILYSLTDADSYHTAENLSRTITIQGVSAPPTLQGIPSTVDHIHYAVYTPLNGVSAQDFNGNDLTSKITWDISPDNNTYVKTDTGVYFFNSAQDEEYTITFAVQDSDDRTTTQKSRIMIQDLSSTITIDLDGDNPYYVAVDGTFTEPGVSAMDMQGATITTSDDSADLDLSSAGIYTITYTAPNPLDPQSPATKTRTVIAYDASNLASFVFEDATTFDEINVGGQYIPVDPVYANFGTSIELYSISDSRFVRTPATVSTATDAVHTVEYAITDSNGQSITTISRTIIVGNGGDDARPIVKPIGGSTTTINAGDSYTERGATAELFMESSLSSLTITDSDGLCGDDLVKDVACTTTSENPGTYSIVYTATDSANRVGTATRIVTVLSTGGPTITLTGANPQIIEAGDSYTELGATAVDVDGKTVSPGNIVADSSKVNTAVPGTYTVTYTATDPLNRSSTATRTVEVQDTVHPVITVDPTTASTFQNQSYNIVDGVTAIDNIDGDLIGSIQIDITPSTGYTNQGNSYTFTQAGTYTIIYDVDDDSGNSASDDPGAPRTRTLTVVSTGGPVITLTGANPQIIEAGDSYIELGATAIDVDGNAVSPNNIIPDASKVNTNRLGTYTVTYTATDPLNRSSTIDRTIRVQDTTGPVIAVNPSSVQINQGQSYAVLTGVSVLDIVDGNLIGSITTNITPSTGHTKQASTYTFTQAGTYTITFDADDRTGNSASDNPLSQRTRIIAVISTDGPTITLAGTNPQIIEAGGSYTELGATAIDVDGNAVSANNVVANTNAVNTAVPGTYTVTYTATDTLNRISSTTRTVEVRDTTNPVITIDPTSTTINQGQSYNVLTGVMAIDNIDGDLIDSIQIDITPSTGYTIQGNFYTFDQTGTYTITYDVDDNSGNSASDDSSAVLTRTISVVSTGRPIITLTGDNPYFVAAGQYVEPGATATPSGTTVENNSDTVSFDTTGVKTVIYTATNGGQTDTISRTVIVYDAANFEFIGDSPLVISTSDEYVPADVSYKDGVFVYPLRDKHITRNPTSLDTSSAGSYSVVHSIVDSAGQSIPSLTRTVNVYGINVESLMETILHGTQYVDSGVTAFDKEGMSAELFALDPFGLASDSTELLQGTYPIIYVIVSSDPDLASLGVIKRVTIESTTPTVLPIGENPASVEKGDRYRDAGARAIDTVGNPVPVSTDTSGVDTDTAGVHDVVYTVMHNGSPYTDTRKVNVYGVNVNGASPQFIQPGQSYEELGAVTFDIDGTESVSSPFDLTGFSGDDPLVPGTYPIVYFTPSTNSDIGFLIGFRLVFVQ